MIKKFIELKNIGKFQSYKAAGDVELRKMTLIYAENGRGKTTLCDVLRSLRTNTGAYIMGRTALGLPGQPEAHIKVNGSTTQFTNGSWSQSVPHIEIFDSSFIHGNVYAGDYVDHEHRKNLYQIIVGEQGVALANAIDAIDTAIRNKNEELSGLRARVAQFIPRNAVSVDDFVALPQDPDIDSKIAAQSQAVSALQRAAEIKAKPPFDQVTIRELPGDLVGMLLKTIDDIDKQAEARVNQHLATCTRAGTAAWLSQGLDVLKEPSCPFCGQSVTDNELLGAYKVAFGQEYRTLKDQITALEARVDLVIGPASVRTLQQSLTRNKLNAEFWKDFVDLRQLVVPDEIALAASLESIRQIIRDHISRKIQAPLEPLALGDAWTAALESLAAEKKTLQEFNDAVIQPNRVIAEKKQATAAGNLADAQAQLARLQLVKTRAEAEVDAACAAFQLGVAAKDALDRDKSLTKEELDRYAEATFAKYQAKINKLLALFNAGFRIVNAKRSYAGGRVSSTYQLSINNTSVDLGDTSTPLETPCFKNTLSSGDRTTLGLAFFLAQLDDHPDLAQKVIVFDDPFTSQDRFRRTTTQQLISKCAASSNQVIVLSHDPDFLKLIWDATAKAGMKTLQLARVGTDTVVNEWDIEVETRPGYYQDHGTLLAYVREGQGERRDVARRIRPVLEGYLRAKFPGHFVPSEWLGDFIMKIRQADASDVLYKAQAIVDEISNINDYSKHYHHQQNANADTHPVDGGELEGFVKRTLDLVGGY